MSDDQDRLQRCFALVFPELPESEIRGASIESVAQWDSLANINLVTLVEEDFQVEISLEDLEKLTSFEAILQYLQSRQLAKA
jgi:acyl carrier protein